MSNETCPHCGAGMLESSPITYACGTYSYLPPKIYRSSGCFERENELLNEEIERLKTAQLTMAGMVLKAAIDEREACEKVCEKHAEFWEKQYKQSIYLASAVSYCMGAISAAKSCIREIKSRGEK